MRRKHRIQQRLFWPRPHEYRPPFSPRTRGTGREQGLEPSPRTDEAGIVMSDQDTFERILAALYDAMLDDARWPAASALLDEACGITGNDLMVGEGPKDDIRALFIGSYYRGRAAKCSSASSSRTTIPPTNACRAFGRLPDSRPAHVTDLYTAEELKTSPTYNEMLPRAGCEDGLNLRLDGPDPVASFEDVTRHPQNDRTRCLGRIARRHPRPGTGRPEVHPRPGARRARRRAPGPDSDSPPRLRPSRATRPITAIGAAGRAACHPWMRHWMRRSRRRSPSRCTTNCTVHPPATCRVVAWANRCSRCSPVRYVTV